MSDPPQPALQLLLDAFFLAMNLNTKLIFLQNQGTLYEGHKIFRIGFKVWNRYHRRRMALHSASGEFDLITADVANVARLHAQASHLVEILGEYSLVAGASGLTDLVTRLGPIVGRAQKRRARRLHTFIIATRVYQ